MTIGIDKTFNVLVPFVFTDSDLLYTTVSENDHAEWSSATTYALGARVIRTTATTHNIYESLQAGNLNKVPESTLGTWWVIVSKTNRWKIFDNSEGSQTVGFLVDQLHYIIESMPTLTAVSLFNVRADEVYVGQITQGEISGPTQKRNLLTPSEYLENAAFTRTNMILDGTRYRAPWGSYTARRVTDTPTNGAHSIAQTVTLPSGNFNTSPANASFYVKRLGGTPNVRLTIGMTGYPSLAVADFDIGVATSQVISVTGGTAIIEIVDTAPFWFMAGSALNPQGVWKDSPGDGGWFRCSLNIASPPSSTVMTMTVSMLGPANAASYAGSVGFPASLLITGLQAEKGAAGSTAPTAYQFVHSSTQYGVRANGSVQTISQFANGIPASTVFTGLNGSGLDMIEVSISLVGAADPAIGELIAGTSYPIGRGTLPVKLGIIDFSQTERNDFGNFGFGAKELVKRDAVQTVEMSVHIEADEAEAVRSLLASLRATPFVIYDTSLISGAGITTFGIWRDFDIEVMAPDAAMLRLKMETLI